MNINQLEIEKENLVAMNITRQHIYEFLSRSYISEVDSEFLSKIVKFNSLFKELGQELDEPALLEANKLISELISDLQNMNNSDKEDLLTELAVDYASLFLNASDNSVYIYESVYLSEKNLVMQEARDEVLAKYRQVGLDKIESYPEPEDHIALELAFMNELIIRLVTAVKEDNEEEIIYYLEEQSEFLEGHILKWIPQVADQLKERANTKFYQALGYLTEGFLNLEEVNMQYFQ